MAKAKKPPLRQKMFKATFYVTVDENEIGEVVTTEAVKDFLNDALIVDVNTEDYDNTVGFVSAQVNVDGLEEIVPV